MKKKILRINEDDNIIIDRVTNDNLIFRLKNVKYKFSDIEAVWYRRGQIDVDSILAGDNKLNDYNKNEIKDLLEYINILFEDKKTLNNFNNYQVNKLEVLKYCNNNRINSLDFLVTQNKNEALAFYDQHSEGIISKAIKSPFVGIDSMRFFSSYTHKLLRRDLEQLPNIFTPTFFQQYIDKRYEVRTFYLNKEFYSMAIFSQDNPKTKIDFRHYDSISPNRLTPYNLPTEYQIKIGEMLEYFKLNCASVDIAVSHDNIFQMLDINPIGQFGMTSYPCNYNLEKKIAEYL